MFNLFNRATIVCLSFIFSFGQSSKSLIITEVMFNTDISNTEFVEIFNPSYQESVNLSFLKFQYSTSKIDELVLHSGNQILQPRSYAIILEKDYDFEENIFEFDKTVTLLTTSDNAFGRSGMANSSDRKIILLSSANDTLDTYTYSADNAKNFSDERVYIDKQTDNNWKNSLIEFGTPGRKNSVAPFDYDLEVELIDHNPIKPIYKQPVTIKYRLKNIGLYPVNNINLKLSIDLNKDSVSQPEEVLYQNFLGRVDPDREIIKELSFNDIYFGKNTFLIEVTCEQDLNPKNNTSFREIHIVKPVCDFNDIVINEIMFAPFNEEPEWIELYNKSNKSVNLQNWRISDRNSSSLLSKDELIISPEDYLVISRDDSFLDFYNGNIKFIISDFPSLNNSGDDLVIRDSLNLTIDSLTYFGNWISGKGKSVERIDPAKNSNNENNWNQTKTRGTPGIINSLSTKDYNIKIDSLFTNPGQAVLNEEISFVAAITNFGKNDCSYSLYLYNESNCIDSLTQLILQKGKTIEVSFNKKILLSKPLQKYSVRLTSKTDYDSTDNFFELEINAVSPKGEILFSEIMFDPKEGEEEWVEIYNYSPFPVNLKGWSFINYSANSFQQSFIKENLIIKPKEYFILAADKNDFHFTENVIEINLGSLNNSEDFFSIKNFEAVTSDSIHYSTEWKKQKGRSIERISFSQNNKSENWFFSLDKAGSTQGKENSAEHLNNYTFGDLSINEIMYDPGKENSEFIELFNHTNFSVDIGGWVLIEGENQTVLSEEFQEILPGGFFVIANDSSIFNFFPELKERVTISNSFSLSNTSETLIISDAFNNLVDSVRYDEKWNNSNFVSVSNRSLEKIKPDYLSTDPENWSTSVHPKGSTPLAKNSIILDSQKRDKKEGISLFPNPFSPDNDGFEDFTEIKFELEFPVSQIVVRVFDDIGRLRKTIENYSAAGSGGSIIYDGKDENGNPLEIGIYILLFEAYDTRNQSKFSFTKPMVIARKL